MLRMDGHNEELAPVSVIVEIYSAIRDCYATILEFVFLGHEDDTSFKQKAGRAKLRPHSIKRKTVTSKLNWEGTLQQAGAEDLKDMLDTLQEMNQIKRGAEKQDSTKSTTTTLKLTPKGGFCLTDDEKKLLETQLRESGGPKHLALENCRLLMNTVGNSITSYSPRRNEVTSLPPAAPLAAFIANAATKLTKPTHIRRLPHMALLNFTTLRMTLGEMWYLAFFVPLVAKNGEMVSKTIKKEANQFSEAAFT